jgi:hypothetical protein
MHAFQNNRARTKQLPMGFDPHWVHDIQGNLGIYEVAHYLKV